ncbi:MAG: Fic family protein [Planctomycetota bacterium]|jgi:Fic family protein
MKKPKTPPDIYKIWEEMKQNPERFMAIRDKIPKLPAAGKYLHWDKLRYYTPPEGLSHKDWWFGLKGQRQNLFRQVPLKDKTGQDFNYLFGVDPIAKRLHTIDQGAGGFIKMPEQVTNPDTRDQYYVNSLIKEAITSSKLEGAVTTRKVAKEMIKSGRKPIDRSEQMIFNNFITMQRIGKLQNEPLSKELVFEFHRLITEKTMDDPSATARFRKTDEHVVVGDEYNEVFHDPPSAEELEERMAAMCDFANGKSPKGFIHPVIRAIILHFWLAYDHPFVDGNGRVARALFYWSMLRHNYWLFEFVSISQIILNAPAKYGRAFLYTETDDNDLTYFIIYHIDVIHRAIKELHKYIERKSRQLQDLETQLRGIATLNYRQRALISHALRHPHHSYTIKSHKISNNVVYQTARFDLLHLEGLNLLRSAKIGRRWHFTPVDGLETKLAELG